MSTGGRLSDKEKSRRIFTFLAGTLKAGMFPPSRVHNLVFGSLCTCRNDARAFFKNQAKVPFVVALQQV